MMPIWEETEYLDWVTDTDYVVGDIVLPDNNYAYEVTTGGTSGLEPSWPTVIGDSVMDDNGVVYECWREYPWGYPKREPEVFGIPTPYDLPEAYYGFFEINGPLTGSRRHHMTANKLSIGGTRDRLIADILWEGSGGRYPDDEGIGISGKVWRTEVYGFYVLWGLRWISLHIPYIPFGHAKCFPIQPSVELTNVSPEISVEGIGPNHEISVIENPGG